MELTHCNFLLQGPFLWALLIAKITPFKIHPLLVVKFWYHSLRDPLVIRCKIHLLRAGKNIICRAVASFFLLRGLTNVKIKEYLFSRSPINCCIRFVWKSNESLRYPCQIPPPPYQATKFTLVSDGWVLQIVSFNILNFWSKSWNIYRMKDTALLMVQLYQKTNFLTL